MDPTTAAFHGATPILRVAGVGANLDYYALVIGFSLDWREVTGIASGSWQRAD